MTPGEIQPFDLRSGFILSFNRRVGHRRGQISIFQGIISQVKRQEKDDRSSIVLLLFLFWVSYLVSSLWLVDIVLCGWTLKMTSITTRIARIQTIPVIQWKKAFLGEYFLSLIPWYGLLIIFLPFFYAKAL